MLRTEYCGDFRQKHLGQRVTACGWITTKRDMGGIIFVDLYDKKGTLQVVFDARNIKQADFTAIEHLRNQSVIAVSGLIRERDEETRNPKIKTGFIELYAKTLTVLSAANSLPFSLEEKHVREDLRLQYRYLDLRNKSMQYNLQFRHQVQKATQDFLDQEGFTAVETPMLTKSTPEGARDYVVPSRVHNGCFYALPQSPQIFKQLLMVGGIDKYYQIARCFRDEDLRADRQPEFTQVDMEMSFIEQEDILVHLEKMLKYIFKQVMHKEINKPFPRMTWQHAMDVYGSDKPDIRFDLPIVDLCEALKDCEFKVFQNVLQQGGVVRAINIKDGAAFTRSEIEELTEKAIGYGAKGMAWIAVKEDGEIYSILTKYLSKKDMDAILSATKVEEGDFILFCADQLSIVRQTLGGLRKDVAQMQGLYKQDEFAFLIVTDFPQFEYSKEQKRYIAMHHPFTMPYLEDVKKMLTDPASVRAQAYDIVLNGVELGSGSIRIHNSEVQQLMFKALGFSEEEIQERFGFMVNAFGYGTPPHGGFAFGLDRFVMLLLGANSLRDVIAFPKMKDASCPMTNAPSPIAKEQLDVLGLSEAAWEPIAQQKHKESLQIDVDYVANLAQLTLYKEEKAEMEKDMQDIIAFANTLSTINTEDIPITAHAVPMENILRDDKVYTPLPLDSVLANAPQTEDAYIFVPKVIE